MKVIIIYQGILLILAGTWTLAFLWGWALPDNWFWITDPNVRGDPGRFSHWWSFPTLLSTFLVSSAFTLAGILRINSALKP